MTTIKRKMTVTGIALAGLVMICGCGHGNTARTNQNKLPSQTAKTEWNDYANDLSPFTKVRCDGDSVTVTYNGAEYQLAAVNGVQTADLLTFCHKQYRDRWQKRLIEDLEPVLHDMGHPASADNTVSLTLVDPGTGRSIEVANAVMTSENRSAVLAAESATASK